MRPAALRLVASNQIGTTFQLGPCLLSLPFSKFLPLKPYEAHKILANRAKVFLALSLAQSLPCYQTRTNKFDALPTSRRFTRLNWTSLGESFGQPGSDDVILILILRPLISILSRASKRTRANRQTSRQADK